MTDGSPHRLCLNLVYNQYEVLVDGTLAVSGATFGTGSRGMRISGTFSVGKLVCLLVCLFVCFEFSCLFVC